MNRQMTILGTMKNESLMEVAGKQLDRVLGFFPRVEAKISALFAVDIAMLAALALNARAQDFAVWYLTALGVIAVVALAASIWFLYRASFPQLQGGASSLIYFHEIAKRTESAYLAEMKECDAEKLASEMLAQVWRNSEILRDKFIGVKHAFMCTAAAVPFWFLALLFASMQHATLVVK